MLVWFYIISTFYIDTSYMIYVYIYIYMCKMNTFQNSKAFSDAFSAASPIFDAVQEPSEQKAPCNHEMHRKSSLINRFLELAVTTLDHLLSVKRMESQIITISVRSWYSPVHVGLLQEHPAQWRQAPFFFGATGFLSMCFLKLQKLFFNCISIYRLNSYKMLQI